MATRSFPPGFIWGTASSSHQSEGDNCHNDWWDWEQQPKRIIHGHRSGKANNFWKKYDDDFKLLSELGLNHYRLSIEWSRIEPEEGRIDAQTLRHYQRILEAAQRRGITPWINLHHFAWPRWFAAKGGLLEESNLSHWCRHVERVGRALAPLARHWHPINEANAYAAASYLLGVMPPGVQDFDSFTTVLRNTVLLYRDAFEVLKDVDPSLQVGTIHVMVPAYPADPNSDADQLAAANFEAVFNDVPLRALKEGLIVIPGKEPEPLDGMRGAADFFGANYYSSVSLDHREPLKLAQHPAGQKRFNQIGNGVHPEGLLAVLRKVRDFDLGVPTYVTENGTGTDDDAWRIEYVHDHLAMVLRAIDEGCDVRGYFHWTSVDNFEWSFGWTAQFGLIAFDPESFERTPRPSAYFLREIARRNQLVDR